VVVIVAVAEGPVTSGAVVTTAGVVTSVVYRGLAVGDRRMVGADNRRIMRAHKKLHRPSEFSAAERSLRLRRCGTNAYNDSTQARCQRRELTESGPERMNRYANTG